jgi:ribosomal protein L18E
MKMTKSTDAVLLALLATLEQRAQAKGDKSIVKGVVARLSDTGANPALVAEIAALRKKKASAAKTIASEKAKPKKVADLKVVGPEEPAVQG